MSSILPDVGTVYSSLPAFKLDLYERGCELPLFPFTISLADHAITRSTKLASPRHSTIVSGQEMLHSLREQDRKRQEILHLSLLGQKRRGSHSSYDSMEESLLSRL